MALGVEIKRARMALFYAAQRGQVRSRARKKSGLLLAAPRALTTKNSAGSHENSTWWYDGNTLDKWEDIEFCHDDLLAHFSPPGATPLPAHASPLPESGGPKRKAGRKPKFDWDPIIAEFVSRVCQETRNPRPSIRRFTDEMLGWCHETFDENSIPEKSTLRPRIGRWLAKLPEWRA